MSAAVGLLLSFVLTVMGVYDVRHSLVGYGMAELWVGGACFVSSIHVHVTRHLRRATQPKEQSE